MAKLRYRLAKLDRGLKFQILWMNEQFRGQPGHVCRNGLVIRSAAVPEVHGNNVYLAGRNRNRDCDTLRLPFPSNQARDDFAQRLHAALKDWADNWPNWDIKPELAIRADEGYLEENVFEL